MDFLIGGGDGVGIGIDVEIGVRWDVFEVSSA